MSIQITSINSGSNANCYYVGNHNEAVLVDAGLSCRETEKRMKRLGLDIQKVKAIFISHEHTDHIAGLDALTKKYRLPVYITNATLKKTNLKLAPECIHPFSENKPIHIGALSVIPFLKSHDADDPHSFIIKGGGINIGVITDIGYACEKVRHYFRQCHAVFLESNYCEKMLMDGSYPYHLKKRISGNRGHLSNRQALDLVLKYKSPQLQLLVLSHLSQNNNNPQIVADTFRPFSGTIKVVVASRHQESELYAIETITGKTASVRKQLNQCKQLSLFD